MKKLTLVVPVFNERDAIVPVARSIDSALKDASFTYDVLFIDDGSTDNPREIFEANGLRYVSHPHNRGYGAAIKTGALAAESQFVAIMDCDGTYPPEEIPRLMEFAGQYPMVVGARSVRQNPWLHMVSKSVVCHLLSCLFGTRVEDINSGLRVIRTDVLRRYLDGLGDRFSLTSSITYGFLLNGLPIKYVPIQYRRRLGRSHVRRLSFTWNFIQSLRRIRRYCLEGRPRHGACGPGDNVNSCARTGRDENRDANPKTSSQRFEGLTVALISLFGFLMALAFFWYRLTEPYNVCDDTMQHTYWMASFHNPDLFRDDMFVRYARYFSPPGFRALYFVFTYLMSPLTFGKILAVVLYTVTVVLAYVLGRTFWDRWSGILMVFYCVGNPMMMDRIDGGLQRAFMYPLLFLFLVVFCRGLTKTYGWVLGLQTLLYPLAAFISAVTLGIGMLFKPSMLKEMRRGGRWALGGALFLLLAIGVTKALRSKEKPDFLGPMITKVEMLNDAAFYGAGRSPYLPLKPLSRHIDKAFFSNDCSETFSYFTLLFLLLAWIKGKSAGRTFFPLLSFFLAAAGLFHLAVAFLFKLYIPERYIEYNFPILGAALAALGGAGVLMLIPRRRWKALALAGVFAWGVHKFQRDASAEYLKFSSFLAKVPSSVCLYRFLATTPVNSVIAANPYLSDYISAFSMRKVLVKYELAHPWYKDYRKMIETRVSDYYKAFFTDSPAEAAGFARAYGVDYWVCEKDPKVLNGVFFSDPLNWALLNYYNEPLRKTQALSVLRERYQCYEDHDYYVIDAKKFLAAAGRNAPSTDSASTIKKNDILPQTP